MFRVTRRELFALGGFALSSACSRKHATGYPGYALVATAGDNSLAVVDLTTFRLIKIITFDASPTAVLTGGPSNYSYVLTPSNGKVHVLDKAFNIADSRKLADGLIELRLTPDGKRLVGISHINPSLIEADATNLRVTQWHALSAPPVTLDIPPRPNTVNAQSPSYVAVSTGSNKTVELFNLTTGQHWRTSLPSAVGAVRFRADAQLLLVANTDDRALSALKAPTLETIAELSLAMQPQNLCFNTDNGQLFVTGDGMDGVAIVFPYGALEVEQTVLAGRDPGVMACSADPSYLFVGSNSGSDVCVLDIDTRRMIGIVDVGEQPTYITITPDNQFALVLNRSVGTMAVIRIPPIQTNLGNPDKHREKTTAALFTMITVGREPIHLAVVPKVT